MSEKILVIIPAYNEADIIADVIGRIRDAVPGTDILVVDDCSADATARCALSAGAEVISLPINLGIGGAVQTALQYARGRNYSCVVRCDGDGQHDPRFIPALVETVCDRNIDLCIGSRFIGPRQEFRSSWPRRLGILFFARLISALLRSRITDPTSGFQAFSPDAVCVFSRRYPIDYPEPESLVWALKYGLTVKEIPVEMAQRHTGRSSIRYVYTLYYMVKVTLAIILAMLHSSRRIT
ncbi:MAG: glycosyltransferase family 2 protein [Candidatus Omnitrophota bacterium]